MRREAVRSLDRVRVNLGRVSHTEAELARGRMQAEEEAGRAGQLIALHLENPDAAVQGLLGHQGYEELLPPPARDFGSGR